MTAVRRPDAVLRATISLLCAALSLALSAQTFPDQTVVDETSLMSDTATAQINARNKQLFDATGLIVVVVAMRGTSGESALTDGIPAADKVAKGSYGALVWVATGGENSDVKSKHFKDQAERYSTGSLRDVYFYPAQLSGHTERTYHPGT